MNETLMPKCSWEHKFSYLILVLSECIFQIKNLGMELLGYIGYYIFIFIKKIQTYFPE